MEVMFVHLISYVTRDAEVCKYVYTKHNVEALLLKLSALI